MHDVLPGENVEIIAACDVQNPLLGERGASRVFGPQKGADARAVETLELALEQLADVVTQDLGCDFRDTSGAGAAGGLGFGLMSFCNAKIRSGFELVAQVLKIEEAIAASDLVITGEGKLDGQTQEGKAPAGIAKLARKHGKPVIAFAGSIELRTPATDLFDAAIQITPMEMPLEEAMQNAAILLENSVRAVAEQIRAGKLLSPFCHLSS
jgi:glycerate kinase